MRVYVEAWGENGQILGNLDGQRSWEGLGYNRTTWYKLLKQGKQPASSRVRYWKIVSFGGVELERVQRVLPGAQVRPKLFKTHGCYRCQDGKLACVTGDPGNCEFLVADNE